VRLPEWTLGDRLVKARREGQVKQADMADHLQRSRAAISDYENDVRQPSLADLARWADLCRVPLGWLIGIDPGEPAPLERSLDPRHRRPTPKNACFTVDELRGSLPLADAA
jgi:transcriptional regulator with XRE-family HTH domain